MKRESTFIAFLIAIGFGMLAIGVMGLLGSCAVQPPEDDLGDIITEILLEDGTHCVLYHETGIANNAGGISCDWQ